VGWSQIISQAVLTIGLLLLALGAGWRQLRGLREARLRNQLPTEENRYLRLQFILRLTTTCFLLLLALMLGYALLFLENRAQELADLHDAGQAFQEGDEQFAEFYRWFWLLFLLLLLGLVAVAAIDLLTIRRWGLRQQRKLLADRRAMLERQLQQMRLEHLDSNGHNGSTDHLNN
jgi:ABC-type multidrug transport system fused ATPase/permease subunit